MLPLLIRMRCNQEPNLIQRTGSLSKGRLNSAMTHSKKDVTQLLLSKLKQKRSSVIEQLLLTIFSLKVKHLYKKLK